MNTRTIICPICNFKQPEFNVCVNCGTIFSELVDKAKTDAAAEPVYAQGRPSSITENTSGQGRAAVIPQEIKGWNWGAFLLNFIWAFGNRTWIGLLSILPVIGYVMPIILGYKGSEWAWRNKRWESIDHFKRVQRGWAVWGVAVMVLLVVIFLGLFYFALQPGEQTLYRVL